MRCEVHCPGPVSRLGPAVAVSVVACAVYAVAGSVIVAVLAVEALVAAVGVAAVRHLVLYGRARKPRAVVQAAPARPALGRAPRLAIEGRVVPRGEILGYLTASQAPASQAAARVRRMSGTGRRGSMEGT